MAGENRGPTLDLRKGLLEQGKTYAFFQALRLLRLFLDQEKGISPGQDPIKEFVRIRPNLSLAHPPNEIDTIDQLPGPAPAYRMTANFLGLYGESSPLPAFYTEDLMDESPEKEEVTRDFYDIFNYPFYHLFFLIWTKYRPHLKVVEEKDPRYLEILFSLLGLGVDHIKDDVDDAYSLLRYIGLFTQFPKSALGLKTLLADALNEKRLEIVPCLLRKVTIPEPQRCYLGVSGNILGRECYLGEMIEDRTRKFRIKIGPVNESRFRQLLPGTDGYRKINSLSGFYLMDPYECDLEISIDPSELETAKLGSERWSRLGIDTWLVGAGYDRPAWVRLEL